jgi:energy-coupling factor transport system ATP-binding protein
MITIENVSYRYPEAEQLALSDVSATIAPAQVVLLRGASGSGKSTLLRCLNGLVPETTGGQFRGRVVVGGLDTRNHPPRQLASKIGLVFQHPDAQFVLEDVEAELAFGLENLGLSRALMRKRIEEVLDQVGIHALRSRRIVTLSGGERQRVAIAAALVMHPSALVLDEPTSQLDPQAAEDVIQVLLRLVAELGMTTIVAEHRVERIAPFVDRVWTMRGGRLSDQLPREALAQFEPRPPVVELGVRAGWNPLPLSVREARAKVSTFAPSKQIEPRPTSEGRVIAQARHVSYRYQPIEAVRDASFMLRAGEITALMGRNGSGKTTMLRLLAQLLRPQRGQVEVDGRPAYVPQDADMLLFASTVEEELGDVPANIKQRFMAWRDRYPRDLSSGERQQLAIAVMAANAQLLLLDEPTRGLDPQVKRALTSFLRLQASNGASILIATHDVEWAARTADRVLLMADGEIYADGDPHSVLSDSLVFSTQVNKLLGGTWLLPEEVPI